MREPHPEFIQPLDPNIKVWRYLDVAKFLALLQKKKLYFCRIDQLGDPFEGSTSQANKKREDYIRNNRMKDPDLEKFRDLPDNEFEQIINTISFSRRDEKTSCYVNCWHINEIESFAMWSLYSNSPESICIQTTYKKLSNSLPDWVFIGLIQYIDYKNEIIPDGNILSAVMRKRKSFEHEREVRALIWSKLGAAVGGDEAREIIDGDGANLAIDLNTLIENIYVNPTSPGWFHEVIQSTASSFGLTASVHQSELAVEPVF